MKRSTALTSLCLCGAIASAFALMRKHEGAAVHTVISTAAIKAPALRSAEPRQHRERAALRDRRPQVVEAVEQASLHVGPASLDEYLATLEARARAQGSVTALEVEPGLEMIQRYDPTGERLLLFARRMQMLQRELAPAEEPAEPSASPSLRLNALSATIIDAESEAARQAAVHAYLDVVRELPPGSEGEALATLNRLTGSEQASVPVATE